MNNSESLPGSGTITILTLLMIIFGAAASLTGIFSGGGPGPWLHESVRGMEVEIYGMGIYKHMSADVAPQGIAQDYITCFAGIPLLLVGLFWFRRRSLQGRLFLAGIQAYFLVTYLFYLAMGTFNALFLVYVTLLGCSFFAFLHTLPIISIKRTAQHFSEKAPTRIGGYFLMINASLIGLLWLSVIVPPLLEGTIIPKAVQHYTTLIVQGFDLALLLPASFVIGFLLKQKKAEGLILGTVYLIFLSLLMATLTAKIIAMVQPGGTISPAIIIIPLLGLFSIFLSIRMIKSIKKTQPDVS